MLVIGSLNKNYINNEKVIDQLEKQSLYQIYHLVMMEMIQYYQKKVLDYNLYQWM